MTAFLLGVLTGFILALKIVPARTINENDIKIKKSNLDQLEIFDTEQPKRKPFFKRLFNHTKNSVNESNK